MAQNSRASAVAEQHARIAIVQLVIEVNLSAPITRTVSYVCDVMNCCAISNPKIKPAQAAENVEAGSVRRSDLFLNEAGCGREQHVGRGRRHKDEIDFLWPRSLPAQLRSMLLSPPCRSYIRPLRRCDVP
jgi:hypothetical protein